MAPVAARTQQRKSNGHSVMSVDDSASVADETKHATNIDASGGGGGGGESGDTEYVPKRKRKKAVALTTTSAAASPFVPDTVWCVPASHWTEEALERFFDISPRRLAQEPRLLEVTWRKRYGLRYKYTVLCVFEHPLTHKPVRQWVRWAHLRVNAQYRDVMRQYDWDIDAEVKADEALLEEPFDCENNEFFAHCIEDATALERIRRMEERAAKNRARYMRRRRMFKKEPSLETEAETTTTTTTTTAASASV